MSVESKPRITYFDISFPSVLSKIASAASSTVKQGGRYIAVHTKEAASNLTHRIAFLFSCYIAKPIEQFLTNIFAPISENQQFLCII